MYRSGAKRKRKRMAETELRESTERAFDIYRKSIKGDPSFKCLGRNMTAGDDYWPAVARNLVKEKKS